jgi:hypothetical protein
VNETDPPQKAETFELRNADATTKAPCTLLFGLFKRLDCFGARRLGR